MKKIHLFRRSTSKGEEYSFAEWYDRQRMFNKRPEGSADERKAIIQPFRNILFLKYRIVIDGPDGTVVETTSSYQSTPVYGGYQLEYDTQTGTGMGVGMVDTYGPYSSSYYGNSIQSMNYTAHRSIFVNEIEELPISVDKPKRKGWLG